MTAGGMGSSNQAIRDVRGEMDAAFLPRTCPCLARSLACSLACLREWRLGLFRKTCLLKQNIIDMWFKPELAHKGRDIGVQLWD